MGVLPALVATCHTNSVPLRYVPTRACIAGSMRLRDARSITAGEHRMVFLQRGPILLVAAARTGETEAHLRLQLQFMFDHIVFLLTSQALSMLERNPRMDLRNLLGGAWRGVRAACGAQCVLTVRALPARRPTCLFWHYAPS